MKRHFLPAIFLALATACGGGATVPLETTPRTPAAIGTLEVEKGPNDNTTGTLRVEHLAPPQKLRDDLTVYVAWVRPSGNSEWQNVGQLVIGESREGSLELVVPYDQFEYTVSAETEGQVSQPSRFVVLTGQVDATKGG